MKYRSKFEGKVAKALGRGWRYEAQKLPYTLQNNYYPDFYSAPGTLVEAKGRFTGHDRRKILAVLAQHKGIDLRLVFMRDNYLYKGAKSRYSDWCKKHGITYSIFPKLPL
jgi:hypothetical protein